MDNMTPPKPLSRKQGPVRLEAIIPLLIVIGLVAIYFTLFFDMHLRRGLEYGATQANGAEVNIGKLDTSLWNASVVIADIALTNPEIPSRNRVQIGSVTFLMMWDALLRGKVLIDEASIIDVQIDTPRKRPGYVLPVKISKDSEGIGQKILAQMKEEFSGNALGDLAAIASGADSREQLASIGGDIRSSEYLTGLQKSLDEKNQQWQSRLAALPKGEDFSALQRRLANVKLDNLQDVSQIQASLQELGAIRSDFDAQSKSVTEVGTSIKEETGAFKGSISGLDKIVKEDVRTLQARMHLPSLDVRTLSRALFGMDVLGKVQQARGYMVQARSYMPAKNEEMKGIAVHERQRGTDFEFGQPDSYPRFWLRKARITSSLPGGEGGLSGEINNLTSSPPMIGLPLVATLQGSFPQQGISGVKASLVIDHTTSAPSERLEMEVGRYAITARSLVSSPSVELGISSAEGSAKFAAELRGENVDVRMSNLFTKVKLEAKAPSAVVREMINASVAGLDKVNVDARVSGTWSSLDWQLSSNMAEALQRGMQRYLQGKMDEAKARIEKMVNERIEEQRKRLYARQSEIETALKSALTERQAQIVKVRAELDAARSKLEERKNALVGAQQEKLKQGAGKALENLRKKF